MSHTTTFTLHTHSFYMKMGKTKSDFVLTIKYLCREVYSKSFTSLL